MIYEIIKGFRFFENFFAQNLRTMNHSDIMSLCKGFEYEKISQGEFVFQKGDAPNNKLYVILSGKVGIIIPKDEHPLSPLLLRSLRSNILQKQISKKKLGFKPKENPQDNSLNTSKVTFKDLEVDLIDEREKPLKQGKAGLAKLRSIAGPLSFMYQKEKAVKKIASVEEEKTQDVGINNRIMTENEGQETNEKEQNLNGLSEPKIFEEYASTFGTFVRYLETGESFSESDGSRSTSMLCSTDCEFLVITKQQFDCIFLKKDIEKETFLKRVFPFIGEISKINLNYILYSFKVTCFDFIMRHLID